MPILALLLALELGLASLLVNLPNKTGSPAAKKVLGQTILLAEDTTPTDTSTTPPSDNSSPAPEPTPPSADNNPAPTPAPTDQTSPPETTPTPPAETPQSPPEQTPSTDQIPSSPTTPEATSPATEQVATETIATPEAQPPTETVPPAPEQVASTAGQAPILNTDETVANPDQVDTGSKEEAQKEDQTLSTITDPGEKATVLTTFASDKINDIDRFTNAQDFNSTSFANTRLSDQIDQLKTLSAQTPAANQPNIYQKLSDVCQQANTILRTAQETVPEDIEQDLEITRGQCLGF